MKDERLWDVFWLTLLEDHIFGFSGTMYTYLIDTEN